MPLPKCENCDNWRRRHRDAREGTCHLRPPAVIVSPASSGAMSAWPITYADDGCRVGFLHKLPPALEDVSESPVVALARRAARGEPLLRGDHG